MASQVWVDPSLRGVDPIARTNEVSGFVAETRKFIQEARERMERKGTVGKFGRATRKKIARAKKKGGVEKKRAVFAENMKKIARKRARRKR